jgi:phospholipid/cholesterol/gamma-HCH transport system permease protein
MTGYHVPLSAPWVTKSVLLELTPLLTALVLAGKVGATITAELGTMRVTEQIDALEALAFDPISFLITPRVIAGILMFPIPRHLR